MGKEKNVNETSPQALPIVLVKDEQCFTDLRLNEFKDNVKNGNCPFCSKKLKWYDGSLGYEAYRCYGCKFTIDHFGMHLDDN